MADTSDVEAKKEYAKITHQYQITAGVALFILLLGTVFYHLVEHLRWLDSVYFCTITLTTVGYGDITPHTDAGKLFTIFYVIVGIGILGTFANLLVKRAYLRRQVKKSSDK